MSVVELARNIPLLVVGIDLRFVRYLVVFVRLNTLSNVMHVLLKGAS